MTLLLMLDCETTGLDPVIHRPWEVAWQIWEHDDTDRTLLRPVRPAQVWQVPLEPHDIALAHPVALQIGGWHDRRGIGNVATPSRVLAVLRHDLQLAGVTKPRDIHLVGACPGFDEAMLAHWWGGSVNDRPWHYHLVDVENLLGGKLGMAPPWEFDTILANAEVRTSDIERHTALGDTILNVRAYAATYSLTILDGAA